MKRVWYRQDREAVRAAWRRGERPDRVTTMTWGPLDELIALHQQLAIFRWLDRLPISRQRAGRADSLRLRTLATLPFVAQPSLADAAGALFREPAVLLQLGWAPAQIRNGDNQRHRHADGRPAESLPCHPDTLRDQCEPEAWPLAEAEALVSTRVGPDGFQALLAYRPRWPIEDDAYRELKQGWGLEVQRWGRDAAAVRGRVALPCLAFNTAQAYRLACGQRWARRGIRRLRQQYRRELGAAPVVVDVAGCYAVLAVEELLAALGWPVQESLLPFGGRKEAANSSDQLPVTEKPP